MTIPAPELLALMHQRLPAILALTEEIVNIDSGSYCAAGTSRVVKRIGAELERLGFAVTLAALPGRGEQLTAVRRGKGRGRLLVLGHADTVWPEGTVAQWPFRNDGERLTGPGVGDMKSCVVMAVSALGLLIERNAAEFAEIKFLLVPDEELGSPQSRTWIEQHAKGADWALTLEPCRPNGGVVTSRGAVGAWIVEAKGISAHSGVNYAKGASALRPLADMVAPLEDLTRLAEGQIVNVGILRGGAARQVVPHEAALHIDLRARTPAQVAALDAGLAAIFARSHDKRVSIAVNGRWTRPAWPRSEGGARLYALAKAIADEIGAEMREDASSGGSDGSFPGALGVPTIDGLGPICFDTCSRQESVPVASIAQRGAIFAGLVARLAAGAN